MYTQLPCFIFGSRALDGSEHLALQIVWIDNAMQCQNSSLALFVRLLTDARLHLTGADWPYHFWDAVQRRSRPVICDGQKEATRAEKRSVIRSERPIDGRWVKAWIKARKRPFKTPFYTKTHSHIYTNTQVNSRGQHFSWEGGKRPGRQKVTRGQDTSETNTNQAKLHSQIWIKPPVSDICLISTIKENDKCEFV